MKKLLKSTIGLLFLPFVILAFIVAIIRVIFTLTLLFTWEVSIPMFDKMFGWIDTKIQNIKNLK